MQKSKWEREAQLRTLKQLYGGRMGLARVVQPQPASTEKK